MKTNETLVTPEKFKEIVDSLNGYLLYRDGEKLTALSDKVLEQLFNEMEQQNKMLNVALKALDTIKKDTVKAETIMECNAYYLAADALDDIQRMKNES